MNTSLSRRSLFGLGLGATAVGLLAPQLAGARPLPAEPSGASGLRVLLATNEPWATYHAAPLLDQARRLGATLVQVVPDRSKIKAGDPVSVITLQELLSAPKADLLVVNGAADWPVKVAAALPGLPVVASSLAYLNPAEVPGAAALRPRVRSWTAASDDEAASFAGYFGTDARGVQRVGNPQLDQMPKRDPEPNSVLVVTSVTHPDATGSSAPGTELLLASAKALKAAGRHVRVGLHPREDASLWSDFEIATEATIPASAKAEVAVGIPGSVFAPIAAVGTPLVSTIDASLKVPKYLLDVATEAATVEQVLAAVEAQWRPSAEVLRAAVGPIGGSAARLWAVWAGVVRDAVTPSPSASASTTSAPVSPSARPTRTAQRPGLPATGR